MKNKLMLEIVCTVLTAGQAVFGQTSAAQPPARMDRPNFLFIMADDLGKEWLSCYGSECHRTPHLDHLADQGMRFESFYVTPLCTPTRNMLLTGRYPFRTGWTVHHDAPRWGGQYFDWQREITFARVLRSAGYATAIAGKWQVNDLRTQPEALREHGFDEHCMWVGFETDNPPSAERYWNPFIQENGRRGTREGAFGEDVFVEFLMDFMTRHKDRPFLAYYPMALPHTPFTTTPANRDTDLKGIPLFPGMVDYVDALVGRLVKHLDNLGIRGQTVIIFTADNGTVSGVKCGRRGQLVNGGKGTSLESGICTPLIASCPGRIPEGRVSEELLDISDVFPTLAELAGAQLPTGVTLDGRSFAALLSGRDANHVGREWIFSQLGKVRVVRDRRFKVFSDGRCYDLIADPQEKNDLATDARAEVAEARQRLSAVLNSFPPDAILPFEPRRQK